MTLSKQEEAEEAWERLRAALIVRLHIRAPIIEAEIRRAEKALVDALEDRDGR